MYAPTPRTSDAISMIRNRVRSENLGTSSEFWIVVSRDIGAFVICEACYTSPISSFHSSGRAEMKSFIIWMHSASFTISSVMPRERV
jgi:hypothetical protein